ncbi:hypothetical protein MUK42_36980 [Musa troglodytarum]|uniref:Uncharacterized protein n=1 Tax=Musa troglodytarum TaxID=320322 RepID=A0A9E7HS39_9LILI|nr:hypothetical protein MUK42_36980 [Musa troglodytarum]
MYSSAVYLNICRLLVTRVVPPSPCPFPSPVFAVSRYLKYSSEPLPLSLSPVASAVATSEGQPKCRDPMLPPPCPRGLSLLLLRHRGAGSDGRGEPFGLPFSGGRSSPSDRTPFSVGRAGPEAGRLPGCRCRRA